MRSVWKRSWRENAKEPKGTMKRNYCCLKHSERIISCPCPFKIDQLNVFQLFEVNFLRFQNLNFAGTIWHWISSMLLNVARFLREKTAFHAIKHELI